MDLAWLSLLLLKLLAAEELQPSSESGFRASLQGHRAGIYALAVSERLVASGSKDGEILTWNLTHQTPIRRLHGHRAGVTALALGGVLASGAADNTTKLWDADSGELLRELPHPKTVFGLSMSGQQLASGCWDGAARIWDWSTGRLLNELKGHEGGLYEVSHSPVDPNLLATASADRTVRIWDLRTGKQLWKLQHKDHVTAVDWSPIHFTLATGGWDRRFRLYELQVPQCRRGTCRDEARHVVRHPQLLWSVAFAPTGHQVAACHGAVGQSPTVVVYEVSGRRLRRLGRHKDTPLALGWAGDYLVSAGMDRQVLVYAGTAAGDDLPTGDADDQEERLHWLQDLQELREGGNVSQLADLARQVASRNSSKTSAGSVGLSFRHPMAGVAFL